MSRQTTQSISIPPFWRDIRFLRVVVQLAFLIITIFLFSWLFNNTQNGLKRAGLSLSFDFLDQQSSFQIDEGLSPSPHTRQDSFAHAFGIGFINTLRVIFIGLILTTIVGLVMGVARLSTNWLIRQIAAVYVEIMQNTPLLLQLIFLYVGVILLLPSVSQSVILPGPIYLSVRGIALPGLWSTATTLPWLVIVGIGLVAGVILWHRNRRLQLDTGRKTYGLEIGSLVFLAVALISWLGFSVLSQQAAPFIVSLPEISGLRFDDSRGVIVSPEFVAIVAGLVLYTGAFIAEIVRAGIQSVPKGQWEAARSQGFSYFQILRLIVLPQALRVMIPPLTNQYINLIKNSSLGAIVGYSDLFGVSKTIQLQSGQAIQVVTIVMISYLILDLAAAAIMNILNGRFQFKTR
ncbi:MAG: ABC transporter permease subunit [Chloroflexota bacterium]